MDDGLRAELLRRVEKDQVARKALDPDTWSPFEPPEGDEPVTVTCLECALATTVRLKR
jgi:hypothetical protein